MCPLGEAVSKCDPKRALVILARDWTKCKSHVKWKKFLNVLYNEPNGFLENNKSLIIQIYYVDS